MPRDETDELYGRLLPETFRIEPATTARPRAAQPLEETRPPTLLMPPRPLSVSILTARISQLLAGEPGLQNVRVEGEITDYRGPQPSGHHYFALKDGEAQLSCVLWSGAANRVKTLPKSGEAVIATGSITVYARRGSYQLTIEDLEPVGQGALWLQFLELKARLQSEGLFDDTRKCALPPYPRVIGIVTSAESAALRDMIKILNRRAPNVEVRIAHATVQGPLAPPEILSALHALANDPEVEVLILARGGGSWEDLACFNDESLVRAMARIATPIVTGVGHEIDSTLVDFVADRRAPTPTAAAGIVVPDYVGLRATIDELLLGMQAHAGGRMVLLADQVQGLLSRPVYARPGGELGRYADGIELQNQRIAAALARQHEAKWTVFKETTAQLKAMNPKRVLRRGYAIVQSSAGTLVRSVADVAAGEAVRIRIADGELGARVERITPTDGDRGGRHGETG